MTGEFTVTVLGCSGSVPGPDSPASGSLSEAAGYRLVLDDNGRLMSAAGEGAALEDTYPPAGGSRRTLQADPAALANLIRDWQTRRPAALQGIIWYRLPVAGDRFNWTPRTLLAVMAGRTPHPRLILQFTRTAEAGPYELRLCNEGEAEAPLPPTVTVRCPSVPQAADSAGPFDLRPDGASPELVFTRRGNARALPAGASLLFGWVRLDENNTGSSPVASFVGTLDPAP